jgi:GNAT superfamily N-acetyltransferase
MMNTDSIHIRTACLEDAQLLSDLGARAFYQAFSADNTAADMAAYLAGAFSPEKQADELANPASTFLLLETGGTPAGYAHLQKSQPPTCITGLKPVELCRFYLLQDWIGKGLGSRLMRACIDQAQGRGGDVLWLGVWQKNTRAIAFYQKWGFEIAGTQTFLLGSDLQHDFVMQRKLAPG